MSFLLYEQILVEFGVSKKVLASSGEHHEVINAIKTAFHIKEEIFLQKFDQDWQEYIDFPEGKFVSHPFLLRNYFWLCSYTSAF